MSEAVQVVVISALVNAAVTWGVISTKLAWLRRDVDDVRDRLDAWEKLVRNK